MKSDSTVPLIETPKIAPGFVVARFRPADRDGSALFGTLSFAVQNQAPKYDYSPLIAEIVGHRHPALLLCAGWSIVSDRALLAIQEATRGVSTIVLAETCLNPWGKPQNYRIAEGKAAPMGRQFFADRDDRTKKAIGELAEAVEQRQFHFGGGNGLHGKNALLLVCGEIGVVSGRNDVALHPLVEQSSPLRTALKNAAIVFNPTHTRMGNAGTLKAKRKFLSRDHRIYLSASNWDQTEGKKKSQKISKTLHSLWYNGDCMEPESLSPTFENEYFCYREWNIVT